MNNYQAVIATLIAVAMIGLVGGAVWGYREQQDRLLFMMLGGMVGLVGTTALTLAVGMLVLGVMFVISA